MGSQTLLIWVHNTTDMGSQTLLVWIHTTQLIYKLTTVMVYIHKITNITKGHFLLLNAFTSLLLYVHIGTTIRSYCYYYKFISLLLYVHIITTIRSHHYYYTFISLLLYIFISLLLYVHFASTIYSYRY